MACLILHDIAKAIHYLKSKDLVHDAIVPKNIILVMLCQVGKTPFAYNFNFVAKSRITLYRGCWMGKIGALARIWQFFAGKIDKRATRTIWFEHWANWICQNLGWDVEIGPNWAIALDLDYIALAFARKHVCYCIIFKHYIHCFLIYRVMHSLR